MTAVIVGASGSVGAAVTRRLVARGMLVVAVARNGDALSDLADPLVTPCTADITDNSSIGTIRSMVDDHVELALFCAGLPVRGSIDSIDPDLLTRGADTKISGVLRLLHAVRDGLGEGSRFVAIGGTLGIEPGPSEAGPGAINAGLFNLMKQISLVYGPRGVHVHSLAPGPMDTPRLRRIAETIADERGVAFDEIWAEYEAKVSLGRLPRVEEVAWAVEMLLADEAAIMHGTVLHLDAGGLRGVV